MNIDIRLKLGFFQHPKTKKLKRKLGADGILALEQLWAWAADYRINGVLSRMTNDDIADAACWETDADLLVNTLHDCGWLDMLDGAYVLHDWTEHQSYVVNSTKRNEASRKAAQARWGKGSSAKSNAKGNANGNTDSNADGNADSNADGNAPNSKYQIPNTKFQIPREI